MLPRSFRKLPISERRRLLSQLFDFPIKENSDDLLRLADAMVESAVGYASVPMGIATGFVIDGRQVAVPMATEEPSVIAAASYAASLIAHHGGFHTYSDRSIMSAQIFLQGVAEKRRNDLLSYEEILRSEINTICSSMRERGGGLVDTCWRDLPQSKALCFEFDIDVLDAMGANVLNTAAEKIAPLLEKITKGKKLMAIVTNAADKRQSEARFALPTRALRRRGYSGKQMAQRIVLANQIALEDSRRAVTHNKGILNGISAVATATGNDTRGVEAAIHAFAARDGRYRGLTEYATDGDILSANLKAPAPLAAVGGGVGMHPVCAAALRILGASTAEWLSRVAMAVGLAQNMAALMALVSDGIQKGHMYLHTLRSSWRKQVCQK